MSDRRERSVDLEELFRLTFEAQQRTIWTALPGVVAKFDPTAMTVDVTVAFTGQVQDPEGTLHPLPIPLLVGVPVVWQGGGGVTVTFPIAEGDECLLVFASRSIDEWWYVGLPDNRLVTPIDPRMHNLSDAFALVGVRSRPRAFAVDTQAATIITDDGSAFFKLNPATKAINMAAPGGVTINGVVIDSSGNLTSPATLTGTTDVVGGGKHLKTHVHSGVQSGGSNTGAPV